MFYYVKVWTAMQMLVIQAYFTLFDLISILGFRCFILGLFINLF